MRKLKHALIAIITAFLVTVFLPVAGAGRAFNKSDIGVTKVNAATLPASGTWGTCHWTIDSNGVLTIGAGTGVNTNGNSPWKDYASQITSVKTDGTVVLPSNSSCMFHGCSGLTALDVSNFNTSKVVSMGSMFNGCSSLTTLDLSSFNTSQVTRMDYMFYGCSGLTSLDLSNFNTSKVTSINSMFYGCSGLTALDVSNFNTSQMTDMGSMFSRCSSLTKLNLSNFNTSKVTNMGFMFFGCSKLTALDVSNFDTSQVEDMDFMFNGCSSLTTLDVSSFNTSQVTNMQNMFNYCSSLATLDVSNFDTSKVTDMRAMFYGCSKLTSLDVSNFDTSRVTSMNRMFSSCSKLTSLDVSNFNTSNVTSMCSMFDSCSSLTTLDVSNFDTSKVTDMRAMFYGCSKLTSLDVSNFDTSRVTSMNRMFSSCSKLTSLDVSNFNTSNVTSMYSMFDSCSSLTTLDVSNFDTSKVTDMRAMFYGCSKLTSLDVSNFDTSRVTSMNWMFSGCSGLTALDLSNFDTSKVMYMTSMFYGCSKLTKLSLGLKTLLNSNCDLSSPESNDTYTGKWTKASPFNHINALATKDLISKYSTSGSPESAVWVWEKKGNDPYSQRYQSDDGVAYNADGTKKTDSSGNFIHNLLDPLKDILSQIKEFINPSTKNPTGYWTKVNDDTWTYTFYVNNANVDWHYWEENVPSDYTADHTETNPGIILKSSSSKEGTINNTADVQPDYGSLKISKIMADSTRTFTFKITLTNADGSALTGTDVFGETAFLNGSANISVKAGDSVTMTNIPAGYKYHVEEINLPDGYETPAYVNQDGTITKNTTANVTCTNKPYKLPAKPGAETGSLTITKSSPGSSEKFTIHVILDNLMPETEYLYNDGSQHKLTADAHGHAEIALSVHDGSSVSFSSLPSSTLYKVSEDASDAIASYKITGEDTAVIMNSAAANDDVDKALTTAQEQLLTTDNKAANITVAYTNTFPEYDVSITKRDDQDGFVNGAVLQIKSGESVVHEWTTVEGEQETVKLAKGEYTLHEVSAPAGYGMADDIAFRVTADGKIIKTVTDGNEIVRNLVMTDKKNMTSLYVDKTDGGGSVVTGAVMSLYVSGNDTPVTTWETDGTSHLLNLEYGKTYTLKETTVPDGYAKADDVTIVTDASGNVTVNGKATDTGSTITVIDEKRHNLFLPNTGSAGTLIITIVAVAGMVIFTLLKKKSEKTEEESEHE